MDWSEFRKILAKEVCYREGNKIVCTDEEGAKALILAINKLLRVGVMLK